MEDWYFNDNTSKVLFTAIGRDHGLEQENRKLKVMGVIKGNCKFSEDFRQILLDG